MEKNILLSVVLKKSVVATTILYEGKLRYKSVYKSDDISNKELLKALYKGVLQLRSLITTEKEFNGDIILNTSNKAVLNWIKDENTSLYPEEVLKLIDLIQSLPVKVDYIYSKQPFSAKYAEEKYIEKVEQELFSIDDLD